MADADADTAEPTRGGKSFKLLEGTSQKRREQILVGVGIAGVLLTIVLIRRSSASAAASQQSAQSTTTSTGAPMVDPMAGTNTTSANPTPGTPSPGSYAAGVDPNAFAALQSQVNGISSALSAPQPSSLPSTLAAPGPSWGGASGGMTGLSTPGSYPTGGQSTTVNVSIDGIPTGHPVGGPLHPLVRGA